MRLSKLKNTIQTAKYGDDLLYILCVKWMLKLQHLQLKSTLTTLPILVFKIPSWCEHYIITLTWNLDKLL